MVLPEDFGCSGWQAAVLNTKKQLESLSQRVTSTVPKELLFSSSAFDFGVCLHTLKALDNFYLIKKWGGVGETNKAAFKVNIGIWRFWNNIITQFATVRNNKKTAQTYGHPPDSWRTIEFPLLTPNWRTAEKYIIIRNLPFSSADLTTLRFIYQSFMP